ncbi:MAG: type II toxin-antitoxin system RelE/ParE family toxin [Nitrospirae bacterium]|nr:type II toxin-antitoxin system RelE/ParE family toxin [Magnetococcales bacterium]HAT50973.1 cytotoxic translational repressor of toxin-antitoxin stability system [Alphaproteobacteria bacterium]
MYKLEWMPKALRQTRKIRDIETRHEVVAGVETLQNFPHCLNVKSLTRHKYGYQLRVGRWRVLFNVHESVQIISIEEVKKRNERTY